MRVLHLHGRIFSIPGVERRCTLAGIAKVKGISPMPISGTAGLIPWVDIGDIDDAVARHIVMVERLAELFRRKHRDRIVPPEAFAISSAHSLAAEQRMSRRSQSKPQVCDLVLREGKAGCRWHEAADEEENPGRATPVTIQAARSVCARLPRSRHIASLAYWMSFDSAAISQTRPPAVKPPEFSAGGVRAIAAHRHLAPELPL